MNGLHFDKMQFQLILRHSALACFPGRLEHLFPQHVGLDNCILVFKLLSRRKATARRQSFTLLTFFGAVQVQLVRILDPFFLEDCLRKAFEVRFASEEISRFHRTPTPRTQHTPHTESLSHGVKYGTIIADPILLGDLVDPVAELVHRDVARATKYYLIYLFVVVATITDSAFGVFLHGLFPFVWVHLP